MTARLLVGALVMITSASYAAGPPATKKAAVSDSYHGVEVTEDYRWLEDWDNPAVKQWSDTQNAYARSILDKLPHVDAIRKQVTEILAAPTSSYGSLSYRGGQLFALKRQPPKQQPFVVVMDSPADAQAARVVVDPNELDDGGAISIDWYKASPDGKLVAVSLSEGGSEAGNVRIYETTGGREVHERIPHVNSGTAGGSLAWTADGKGLFYTRHFKLKPDDPDDINVFQHVYYHQLGTSVDDDRYELGQGFPQISEIQLDAHDASGRLLATVQKGDGGEFAHYLRSPGGQWRQFSSFGDGVKQAVFGPEDSLYVVTLRDSPLGKLLRLPIKSLEMKQAQTVIPEGKDAIVTSGIAFWGEQTVLPTEERLYVVYQLGGPSEIRIFNHDGRLLGKPPQLDVSAVHGLTRLAGDDVLFGNVSFIAPDAYYYYQPLTGKSTKTAIAASSPVDLSDAKVVREFAVSKDGTKVPLNIIMKQGTRRDGSNACIVNGYGGYGVNIEPRFRSTNRILLDQGVIFVVANLRGGGEYGERWHLEGNLTNKQNVFDDFAAVLQHLIERQYTSSSKLAIMGGSNGGLLMGATMTQHPDLVKAVVSHVGIYDMLRVELSANGAFNIPEFGTVKNESHFQALHAYSPYHNVKDGTEYPATLFLTGANDPRVDPMQSRKMTARLQSATQGKTPVLLRTSANAGHGGGNSLSERIEQSVDVYAFLFDQLGIEFRDK